MSTDTYTIEELKEYIASNVDEVYFLELLDVSTDTLVEKFTDEIETRYDFIVAKLGLEGWEEGIDD